MDESIMNIIERYIILLLGVIERPIPSILHIEKELFILSKTHPLVQQFFNFEKHYKGPYSQVLKEVIEEPAVYEDAYVYSDEGISLSLSGKKIFNNVLKENKNEGRFIELINALKLIRNLYDKLSEDEMMFLIYVTYSEYTKLSNVSDRLLKDKNKRRQLSENLLKKGLITEERYKELIAWRVKKAYCLIVAFIYAF
jgi:hypothetical protein